MSSGEGEAAAEESRSGPRSLCPQCGAVHEPDQEYCLVCGTRLLDTRTLAGHLAERWRETLPPVSRVWVWPVLVALAVSIAASAIAIVVTRDPGTETIQALGLNLRSTTTAGDTRTTTATSATASRTSATNRTTTTSSAPTAPVESKGLIAWPGPPAYTIVLASLPVSSGKAAARQKALEAVEAGLGDVGVLESSDFSSLHPGYYVVFSGIYKSEQTALGHKPAAERAGFDSTYVKRVAS